MNKVDSYRRSPEEHFRNSNPRRRSRSKSPYQRPSARQHSPGRSRGRSRSRSRERNPRRDNFSNGESSRNHQNFKDRYDERRTKKYEMIRESRRVEREELAEEGTVGVWGLSPREPDYDSDINPQQREVLDAWSDDSDLEKKKKKNKKKSKKHKKKSKKKRKKKHRHRSSSESSESESEGDVKKEDDEWTEAPKSDNVVVGPMPVSVASVDDISAKDYGQALLPGEGDAMAAYVKEGKRIPRRGEIGLTSEEIEDYEKSGYVMSGSRHRRMEAVRLRKENQVYSADEKRALAMYNREEKSKRENVILADFRELIQTKLAKSKEKD